MFSKIMDACRLHLKTFGSPVLICVTLFALFAVALAAPKPEPKPQFLAYSTGLDYAYPAVSPYGAVPYAASPVVSPYASPVAYSTYPAAGAYFVR